MSKPYLKPEFRLFMIKTTQIMAVSNVGGKPIVTDNNDYIGGGGSSNIADVKSVYFSFDEDYMDNE